MDLPAIIVQGLTFGSIYGLIAISMNVAYRPTRVLNFAHGDFVMLGGLFPALLVAQFQLPWGLAVGIGAIAVGVIAALETEIAILPILRQRSNGIIWVVTTLAFSMILHNIIGKIWTDEPRSMQPPWPLGIVQHDIAGFRISSYQVALIVSTQIIALIVDRLYRLPSGKAAIAIADDREAALLRGINVRTLCRWSLAISAMLAAFVGALLVPLQFASISAGMGLLLKGFVAMAIGGLGVNRGALIGGYLIALVEALGAQVMTPGYSSATVLVLALIIFMVRPQGLFNVASARMV